MADRVVHHTIRDFYPQANIRMLSIGVSNYQHLRIAEAARLGFRKIIVSGYSRKGNHNTPNGIDVVYVNRIDEIPKQLF